MEESMHNRRDFLMVAGSAGASLAMLGWPRPVRANACSICQTTSLLLPLSGALFLPPSPCVPAGENVSIIGDVHAVTKVSSDWSFDLYLNMAGVDGVGQLSGSRYIGTGSNKFIGLLPPNPCNAAFTLETTNGCASVPLPVTFQPVFASDGTLLPASTVTLRICTQDKCF
jgi:hypothetical protein